MKAMKWYFTLNEGGTRNDVGQHAKYAILSARKNTTLQPHLLYIGQRNGFTDWAEERGVRVIDSVLPYMDTITQLVAQGRYSTATLGHWLRTNVCLVEREEEFVLYTDVDVLFCRHPDIETVRPACLAAAPEFKKDSFNYFNAGVMIVNVPQFRREYDDFERLIRTNLSEFAFGFHDQIAYNLFYRSRWDRLPIGLNWKPYWGIDGDAAIIHFHGPKVGAIEAILAGKWDWTTEHGRQIGSLFATALPAYRHHFSLIAEHAVGLEDKELARIVELAERVGRYDGSFNGEVSLAFTDYRMFPER
jgi:hypothetical protein